MDRRNGPNGFIPLIRPSVGKEELEEVGQVIASGWLASGPKVKDFERRFSTYVGAKYAVATSSCTTALSLAIESLGVVEGGDMVVPDFTFPATANVVVRAGARPVLVDVERDTYGISASAARAAMGRRTSSIIPVHPFGHPFDADPLYEAADKLGVEVIEDAATAVGTEYKGRRIGAGRRAVCFSFHPRKLLTTAEGGCLVTDDEGVYERAKAMRSHGQVTDKDGRSSFRFNGLNYRMSDVHAAIGLAQLRKLDAIISSRRRQAKVYGELIEGRGLDVQLPAELDWGFHTYQSYVVVLGRGLRKNAEVIQSLRERYGVETQLGTYSLAAQPAFKTSARKRGRLEVSARLFARSVTLPLYMSLSEEEQEYVVDSLASAAGR